MTHRPNVVRIADAVIILANGAIQAYGPRQPVLTMLAQRGKKPQAEALPDTDRPQEDAA
jgi:ABC-type protease/lipase transport system fused ATPase/permease subunit